MSKTFLFVTIGEVDTSQSTAVYLFYDSVKQCSRVENFPNISLKFGKEENHKERGSDCRK